MFCGFKCWSFPKHVVSIFRVVKRGKYCNYLGIFFYHIVDQLRIILCIQDLLAGMVELSHTFVAS